MFSVAHSALSFHNVFCVLMLTYMLSLNSVAFRVLQPIAITKCAELMQKEINIILTVSEASPLRCEQG